MAIIEGQLDARKHRFAIIVSRFNGFITEQLLQGALDCLQRHGAKESGADVYRVPGSYEIPVVAAKLAETKRYQAIICLGVLIRGATPHFDAIVGFVSKAIGDAGVKTGVPTIFGVLTTDTIEQAIERAGTKSGNKGWDAALAAIEMSNLMSQFESTDS